MRHFRLGRLAATVAMLGSTLGVAGGTLLATAGPAHADAGGVNICTTFNGVADATQSPPVATGTLSGCHQQTSGVLSAVFDITGSPAPGDVAWQTGHATSAITLQAAIDFSGGPCPAGDIAADVTIVVGGGPYATPPALTGSGILCADISGGLNDIVLTNFGNVVI
jgi:hypothetical protein